jgi:cell division protein FtsQ
MKRPEGFDRSAADKPERQPTTSARPPRPTPARTPKAEKVVTAAKATQAATRAPVADREAKKAASSRRRYERNEVKRFTRRSRRRRITALVSILSLVLTGALVTGAVYSPLLSLKTITVEGASRIDAASVRAAVKDQLGKPLATVDFGRIKSELSKFPLIRSYVTEIAPPDTLIIRVAERVPIGTIATSKGFTVVDPAGVEIEAAANRPASFPLIQLGTQSTKSPGFTAAVAVLLALPAEVLKRVDTVTAQTTDDVTLVLTGAGQSVIWGSAENSVLKARVLVALIATQSPNAVVKYDVSAPNTPVVGAG